MKRVKVYMEYHSQQLMEDGKGRISTKDMVLDWGAIGFGIGNKR